MDARINRCWYLLANLALVVPSSGIHAAESGEFRHSQVSFRSGNQKIALKRLDPVDQEPRAAIVLLHGLDGAQANAAIYDSLANTLARQGYRVFFPHYFDAFATEQDELGYFQKHVKDELPAPDSPARDRVYASFTRCLEVVRGTLKYVHAQPDVDGKRVGVVGLSLGGFLAITAATDPANKVAAVVKLFAGLPREFRDQVKHLPPVLILHGDQDRIVSVELARELDRLMKTADRPNEMTIYKGAGHVFLDEAGKFDSWSALLAVGTTTNFLRERLK